MTTAGQSGGVLATAPSGEMAGPLIARGAASPQATSAMATKAPAALTDSTILGRVPLREVEATWTRRSWWGRDGHVSRHLLQLAVSDPQVTAAAEEYAEGDLASAGVNVKDDLVTRPCGRSPDRAGLHVVESQLLAQWPVDAQPEASLADTLGADER